MCSIGVAASCAVIRPAVQYPAEDLNTEVSRTPIPVARSLALELAEQVRQWHGETILTDGEGGHLGPWALERALCAQPGRRCRACPRASGITA